MVSAGLFRTAETQTFDAGARIFNEGESGDVMYFVKSGQVQIQIGPYDEVVEEGSIFGEMSLIDNGLRSASAVAKTDCTLVPIDRRRFQFLVQETPYFALEVMKVMADRLRHTNARVVELKLAGDGR